MRVFLIKRAAGVDLDKWSWARGMSDLQKKGDDTNLYSASFSINTIPQNGGFIKTCNRVQCWIYYGRVMKMGNDFLPALINWQKQQTIAELRECNKFTQKYGLYLSEQQMIDLTERRFTALQDTGRIEFGQGILTKLLRAFCDSPYIMQDDYEETILVLQDCFYYFKNECEDRISDDELMEFMKNRFDGICQGSLDYLAGTSLEELCRNTRYGYEIDETDTYGRGF